jgi:chaperonin cofactor prefoldin
MLAWHQQQPLDAPRDVRQLLMQTWEKQLRWRDKLKQMKIPQGIAASGIDVQRSAELEAKNSMLERRVESLSTQLRELTLQYSTAQSQLQEMATKHEASHERAAVKIQSLEQATAKLHEQVETQGKLVAENAGNITESVDQFQEFTRQFL